MRVHWRWILLKALNYTLSFVLFAISYFSSDVQFMVNDLADKTDPLMKTIALFLVIVTISVATFLAVRKNIIGQSLAVKRVPGSALDFIAEFLFSALLYETVFKPTIQDFREEYRQALARNSPWKSRWVCARGHYSFWSAVVAQLAISVAKMVDKIWKATR